jgi:hypothetical protein
MASEINLPFTINNVECRKLYPSQPLLFSNAENFPPPNMHGNKLKIHDYHSDGKLLDRGVPPSDEKSLE